MFKTNFDLVLAYSLVPLLTGPTIILEIYIMSWLDSFVNPDNGPIFDE